MSSVLSREKNVLGGPLLACSYDPLTGFFRDGCCATHDAEGVAHLVCIKATAEFLEFSRSRGNDLSTPRPEMRFKGLDPRGRGLQGRHGAAGGPRIHSRERPQVRPAGVAEGPRARFALNPCRPNRVAGNNLQRFLPIRQQSGNDCARECSRSFLKSIRRRETCLKITERN